MGATDIPLATEPLGALLVAMYYFIFHNIRCFCFFRARTSRNTRQTSRKGRNRGQNARTRRSILFSFYLSSK